MKLPFSLAQPRGKGLSSAWVPSLSTGGEAVASLPRPLGPTSGGEGLPAASPKQGVFTALDSGTFWHPQRPLEIHNIL